MNLLASIKERLLHWREWELNAVVVKELRQSVRSWAVTGMLLLFLTVLFCTSLAFFISQSFRVSVNQRLGASIFQAFTVILTGASLLFIPLYVGIRLAAERQESNLDLLYITTLTPHQIIRGKFLCGAYMTVLFFSACMPFMVFTNLLRGIDLPTIFFILVCLFLVVCAAVQVAIFLACLPISKVFKILVALLGLVGAFSVIGPLVFFFLSMMRIGVGSMLIGGPDFRTVFFTTSGLVLALVLLLYFLSVALISPVSANRALPVRIYLTALWLVSAGLSGYWVWKQRDVRFFLPWAIVTFIVLAGALVVVVSNNDVLSYRVRRRIPQNAAKRALAFLFYNGAAGGLVWVVLLLAVTMAVTCGFQHWAENTPGRISGLKGQDLQDFELIAGASLLYALAYALTGLFIHRRFFGRRQPRLAGVFAILLPGAWALVPNLVLFALNRLSFRTLEKLQLGNIFNTFVVKEPGDKVLHLICAAACVVLLFVLNARWFDRQIRHFQPLYKGAPPVIAESAPSMPETMEQT